MPCDTPTMMGGMSTQKLAAVVATVDDVHRRNMAAIMAEYQRTHKPALYNGYITTYTPFDDKTENHRPDDRSQVQVRATEQLTDVINLHGQMWTAAAVRDKSNQQTSANVVVDGETLIEDAPPHFLMYLEKQLEELKKFVLEVPVRDPAEIWEADEDTGHYRTPPIQSNVTAKMDRVITLAPATDKHPAQTHLHWEDRPVGIKSTIKFTGAWTATAKKSTVDRIVRLIDAVKRARVEANRVEAAEYTPVPAILGYLWPAEAARPV
jgi:hypothetical protein